MNIFAWLFPQYCLLCKREGQQLCSPCYKKLLASPSLPHCPYCSSNTYGQLCERHKHTSQCTNIFIGYRYNNRGVKKVIHHYKYYNAPQLAIACAQLLNHFLPPLPPNTIICPIPSSKKRTQKRSYAPTTLLCKHLSLIRNIPYLPLLMCKEERPHQAGLTRQERIINIKGNFLIDPILKRKISPTTTILLIDDVFTTGATMEEAAKTLHTHFSTVYGAALAQNK